MASDEAQFMASDLWKYCDKAQAREALLSLGLTGNLALTEEKQLSLLYGLANHAEEHYKKVQIPKRNGKIRTLYVPDNLLKYIQKQILHKVLMPLPLSPCASAYKKGCSLRENVLPHMEKSVVLKLDISDFFGNITFISVYQHALLPRPLIFPIWSCFPSTGIWRTGAGPEKSPIPDTAMTWPFPAVSIPVL